MIKNKDLIKKMSLTQKIKFITNTTKNSNRTVDDFDFPVFSLLKRPLENNKNQTTIFPKTKMISRSWDLDLIEKTYKALGIETKVFEKNKFYNMSNDLKSETFSSDPYLNGKMISRFINGLKESYMPSVLSYLKDGKGKYHFEIDMTSIEIEIKESNPECLIINDLSVIRYVKENLKYDGFIFSYASDLNDCILKMNEGVALVFLDNDLTEEIENTVYKYDNTFNLLKNRTISKKTFDDYLMTGEIISQVKINECVDNLISYLVRTQIMQESDIIEEYTSFDENKTPYFDEIGHSKISLEAARNSIVLLKNNNALPITYTEKVGFIGDYALNSAYQLNGFLTKPTNFKTTYELINEYDINPTGFSHGYNINQELDVELIKNALSLSKKSDKVVLYLYAIDSTSLSFDQLSLIDELYKNGIKIIAVLTTNRNIDMSFDEKCEAVLLSGFAGQETSRAILDILIGDFNPAGRLTSTILNDDIATDLPTYIEASYNGFSVKYPFGYGMSYSNFLFSHLEIKEDKAEFTIKNIGNYDGFVTPQLYVGNLTSSNPTLRPTLKGFKKVFIKKDESIKIEIPFDEYTFRYYDYEKNCYGIEGGIYSVTIRNNFNDIMLESYTTLNSFLDVELHNNEITEYDQEQDDFNKLNNEVLKENKMLGFGTKITSIILFTVYLDVLCGICIYYNRNSKYFIYILLAFLLIALISTLFGIVLFIKAIKKKEKPKLNSNQSLTDLVSKVKEFNYIAKVVYEEPVIEEEKEPEIVEEENKEYVFEKSEFNLENEKNKFVSLADLTNNLNQYLKQNGILIDLHSTKRLLSNLISNKLLFVNSNDIDLLKKLIILVKKYFGIEEGILSLDDNQTSFDLYWKMEDEKYLNTSLVNSIKLANLNNDSLNIASIFNVDMEKFNETFKDFIKYFNNPSLKYKIDVKDDSFILNNITFILQTNKFIYNELLDNANYLYLTIQANNLEADEEISFDTPSYIGIINSVNKNLNNYYLKEENYKKLDEFEELINKYCNFEIGNKKTLQIEKYSSILLSLDVDENSCINDIFKDLLYFKIRYLKNIDKLILTEFLERNFNEEVKQIVENTLKEKGE